MGSAARRCSITVVLATATTAAATTASVSMSAAQPHLRSSNGILLVQPRVSAPSLRQLLLCASAAAQQHNGDIDLGDSNSASAAIIYLRFNERYAAAQSTTRSDSATSASGSISNSMSSTCALHFQRRRLSTGSSFNSASASALVRFSSSSATSDFSVGDK